MSRSALAIALMLTTGSLGFLVADSFREQPDVGELEAYVAELEDENDDLAQQLAELQIVVDTLSRRPPAGPGPDATPQPPTTPPPRDGEHVEHHDNGAVSVRAQYAQGKLNGPFVVFDDAGNKLEEGQYANDLRTGRHRQVHRTADDRHIGPTPERL